MTYDLFGSAFEHYFDSGDDTPIEVCINGEAQDPMPPSYFFRSFDQMPKLEQTALKRCRGRVLDVGAAAGCHSLWLQEKGFQVVALEKSAGACKVLRKRQIQEVVNAEFSAYRPDAPFDTILFMMNGLGMGQNISGFIDVLKQAKSLLSPDGEIIGDTSDICYFFEGITPIKKGRPEATFKDQYYGIADFEIAYKARSEKFRWMYPDPQLVVQCAEVAGLNATCIGTGKHYDYLFAFRH